MVVMADSSRDLPGVRERPRRFVPRFHWELLACGTAGHALEGTDAREVREQDAVFVREARGVRWYRCLRCDSWLPLPPPETAERDYPPERSAIELPLRGRPLRDKIVLRLIAVNRAIHFVVLGLLAIAILVFAANREDVHAKVVKVVADLSGGTSTR